MSQQEIQAKKAAEEAKKTADDEATRKRADDEATRKRADEEREREEHEATKRLVAREIESSKAGSDNNKTVKANLSMTYTHGGILYGPGVDVEIPKAMADNLRRQGKLNEDGSDSGQSVVAPTGAGDRTHAFVNPDHDFAREELAVSFPGRDLLLAKGITKRSGLSRMSDVDLLQLGATRELVAQIRDAMRVGIQGTAVERAPQTGTART